MNRKEKELIKMSEFRRILEISLKDSGAFVDEFKSYDVWRITITDKSTNPTMEYYIETPSKDNVNKVLRDMYSDESIDEKLIDELYKYVNEDYF